MSARWRPWIRSIAATPAATLSSARIASTGIIGGPCPAASTPYTVADRGESAQGRRIALPQRTGGVNGRGADDGWGDRLERARENADPRSLPRPRRGGRAPVAPPVRRGRGVA